MSDQKLVTLIDGSVYAESVCDHASWIAEASGAGIELLHVIGRRQAARQDVSGTIALGARSSMLEELTRVEGDMARIAQQHGRALLDGAAERITARGLARPETRLRIGDLIDETNEALTNATMLVIGKRGEAADFARMHLGSNLERMVRSSTKPIFVASRTYKPIKRIMIAYDGHAPARKAVESVGTNPLFNGMEVKLLMVGENTEAARSTLDEPTKLLENAGLSVSSELVPGEAVEVISARASSDTFDMLVMGAYGGGRLRSMFIGSTTTEMLVSCRVPVLLFR
ncbi:universal stress protein [Alphaproteobacteria bacterium]|nr:universal stress protein [Alphaproteobacteria bacterium]